MKKYFKLALLSCLTSVSFGKELPLIFKAEVNKSEFNPFKTYVNTNNNYCIVNPNNPEAITSFQMGNFINTSPAENALGYEDFSDLVIDVVANRTIPIQIKGNTNGNYLASYTAFIDLNHDGQFVNDDGEKFDLGVIENSTGLDDIVLNATIQIPLDRANVGTTRMRIMKRQTTRVPIIYPKNGCNLGNTYGQVEDYTINISIPQGCQTSPNGKNVEEVVFPVGHNSSFDNFIEVTNSAKTGAYTDVFLYKGNSYKFKVNNASVVNTIINPITNEVLTSGLESVTLSPTFNGIVRWYIHADDNCNVNENLYTLSISNAIYDPITDNCNVGTSTADFNLSIENGGNNEQQLAFDIIVSSGRTITVNGLKINLIGDTNSINFDILNNQNNLPGSVMATAAGTITNQEQIGIVNNVPAYEYTVMFENPIILDGNINSKYWLKLNSSALALETTTNKIIGERLGVKINGSWQLHQNYEAVYQLIAHCSVDICEQNTMDETYGEAVNVILHIPDLFVAAFDVYKNANQDLEVTGLEIEMVNLSSQNEVAGNYINLDLRSDLNGMPGALITTIPNQIVNKEVINPIDGDIITRYKVNLEFDQPLILTGEASKFWITVSSDFYGNNSTDNSNYIIGDLSYQGIAVGEDFLWSISQYDVVYNLITNCEQASTKDINSNKPKIYPNPTDRQLTIQADNRIDVVEIYNLTGQKIRTEKPFQNVVKLDLSDFVKGIYLLKVIDQNGEVNSYKIIKK